MNKTTTQEYSRYYSTDFSRDSYKDFDDFDVLLDYRTTNNEKEKKLALETLIERHDLMLYQIARNFSKQYPVGDLNDWLQHARVAAINAYNKYNYEKRAAGGTQWKNEFYGWSGCANCSGD
jgi:hypothetical protein